MGDSEIRERSLPLTKTEQTVLVSVDGEASYLQLSQQFEEREFAEFEMAMVSLLQKGLIEPMEVPALNSHTDLLKADIAGFEAEDFFSSSGDPMHSGSGLVVDTRSNTMRSVNAKKAETDDAEVDLFIPLADEDAGGRKKKRMQKLVEVYPDPSKQKRKKRRKRAAPPPENKWIFRAYLALIGLGLIAVLAAVLFA